MTTSSRTAARESFAANPLDGGFSRVVPAARPPWFPPCGEHEYAGPGRRRPSFAGRAPESASPVTRRDGGNGGGRSLTRRRRGDESGTWSPVVELDVLTRGLGRKLDAEIVILFGSGEVGRPAEMLSSWGLRAPSGSLALPRKEGLVGRTLESGR